MVRTQIELTEQQVAELTRQAQEQGLSLAEVVRKSIDLYLGNTARSSPDEELRRRAIQASGRFASGQKDLSTEHDRYLAEVYGQ